MRKRYNVEIIYFIDDLFAISKDWVMEFCNELIKQNIKLKWICQARVNTMDLEMLRKMKSSGCMLVNVGFESGSQRICLCED